MNMQERRLGEWHCFPVCGDIAARVDHKRISFAIKDDQPRPPCFCCMRPTRLWYGSWSDGRTLGLLSTECLASLGLTVHFWLTSALSPKSASGPPWPAQILLLVGPPISFLFNLLYIPFHPQPSPTSSPSPSSRYVLVPGCLPRLLPRRRNSSITTSISGADGCIPNQV